MEQNLFNDEPPENIQNRNPIGPGNSNRRRTRRNLPSGEPNDILNQRNLPSREPNDILNQRNLPQEEENDILEQRNLSQEEENDILNRISELGNNHQRENFRQIYEILINSNTTQNPNQEQINAARTFLENIQIFRQLYSNEFSRLNMNANNLINSVPDFYREIYETLNNFDVYSIPTTYQINSARRFLENIVIFRTLYTVNEIRQLNRIAYIIINSDSVRTFDISTQQRRRESNQERRRRESESNQEHNEYLQQDRMRNRLFQDIQRLRQSSPELSRQNSPEQPRQNSIEQIILENNYDTSTNFSNSSKKSSKSSKSSKSLNSPNNSKSLSFSYEKSNSFDENDINTKCKTYFNYIKKDIYKNELLKLKNKIIKFCSKYENYKNNLKKENLKKINLINNDIININKKIEFNIKKRKNILKDLFFIFKKDKSKFKKFLKAKTHQKTGDPGLVINFTGDQTVAIDFGGPQLELISELEDKINNLDNELFIKIPDNDEDRYIPNINLNITKAKSILSIKKTAKITLNEFYYFIGQIVFFLFKSKSGLKFKLARTLLFKILTKYNYNTKNNDKYKNLEHQYIYYYLLDSSNFDMIKYIYTTDISTLNSALNENFTNEKEIYKYILDKSYDTTYFNNEIIDSFIKGFHSISNKLYNYFNEKKFTVIEFENMLFLSKLTLDNIKNILIKENILKQYKEKPLPVEITLFIDILENNVNFPTDYIEKEKLKKLNKDKKYPENHIEFIELLLKFWTGSKILYENTIKKYNLFIENREDIINNDQPFFIRASTCFSHLYIGKFKRTKEFHEDELKKLLYECLISEVANIGFTMS
jgi:hypothetical protein